jgi:hypothetical protein
MVGGRRLLDAQGVAEATGRAVTTVRWWSVQRDRTGFPPAAKERLDGRLWYDAAAVRRFWRAWQARTGPAGLDRSGDPDELVGLAEVARMVGARSVGSLRQSRMWPRLAAHADDVRAGPAGRPVRRWRRATVWATAGDLPRGRGSHQRPGPRSRPGERGTIGRSGDPAELVGSTEAARLLGYSGPTALPEALRQRADDVVTLPSGRVRRRWRRETLLAFLDETDATSADLGASR